MVAKGRHVHGLQFLSQAKEDATVLINTKIELEDQKKIIEASALEKDAALQRKIKTVGNYVHDSVPVSNNEVFCTKPLEVESSN